MRGRGSKAGSGEVRARDPWILRTRWARQKLRINGTGRKVLILKMFLKESTSEGSVQGDSNNDKLMVSTNCLFDLLRFSLITCQICISSDICQTISSGGLNSGLYQQSLYPSWCVSKENCSVRTRAPGPRLNQNYRRRLN